MVDFFAFLNRVRHHARKAGFLRPLNAVLTARQARAEARLTADFFQRVKPGDIVWDVGAHLGYYTARFSESVGNYGKVVAFEPSPLSFQSLKAALGDVANITLRNESLGDSSLLAPVTTRTGDDLLKELPAPTLLHIDVGGFEDEVLSGMAELLSRPSCRALLVAVHPSLLRAKGGTQGPRHIRKILKGKGFSTRWYPGSHLLAWR